MARIAAILVFGILIATCGAFAWKWKTTEQAWSQEMERAAALQMHVDALQQDIERLKARIEKYENAEKESRELDTRREIENQVQEIRALPFKEKVKYREIERSKFSEVLLKKIGEQFSDKELQGMSVALAAMGLIPGGTDIKQTLIDLLAEQVGAFYDQHSHMLFMFKGSTLENHQDRIILAHELTHALQDQHFQLSRFPLELKDNDDLVMATSALVEGDATLLMSEYMMNNLSWGTLRDSVKGMFKQDMKKLASAPLYLRESLVFPYLRGQEFCGTLYQQGGWGAISQAFRDPPKSSTQILHPDKYLARPREDPIPVQFPTTQVLGQQPIWNNVMGEYVTRLLFTDWLTAKEGERAGTGWRGDRYLVYGDAKSYSIIWKSLWSSASDAEEFRLSEARCLRKRYQLPQEIEDVKPESPVIYDGARFIRLSRQGNAVIVVDAADKRWADELVKLGES